MAKRGPATIKETYEDLKSAAKINLQSITDGFGQLEDSANSFNKSMGESRARIIELRTTIGETLPDVINLGGNIKDVSQTMSEIALASRRNVIANTEDITKLYAASKVLGVSAGELSDKFLNVGVGIAQLPKQLESSIAYIQSIGGNTKQVMQDVERNMGQLNRYQFEGGVQGLTKMAAQASMLRFDMNQTFTLSEKVLSPEGAIETASAFQRLGVSVGGLADPFQLMNQAINDPSGLQDSLVNVSKQFTYFDEKTKTFKINPQGVLTLKEMEKQTGVSASEMTKLGLAAAEADKRMSQISPSITFKDEEDKQYLQNIAKMGDKGAYEVTLTDGTKKELADLTQPEFDKLIDKQKEQPKTLEGIALAQLSTTEQMKNGILAMSAKVVGSITTQGGAQRAQEDTRTTITAIVQGIFGEGTVKSMKQNYTEKIGDEIIGILQKAGRGAASTEDFKVLAKDVASIATNGIKMVTEGATKGLEGAQGKMLTKGGEIGRQAGVTTFEKGTGIVKSFENMLGIPEKTEYRGAPLRGTASTIPASQATNTLNNQSAPQSTQINKTEVDGEVTIHHDIKIEGAQGLNADQLNKALTDTFNTTKFQDYIKGLARNPNPTKTPAAAGSYN
jgi:hypothetical protein